MTFPMLRKHWTSILGVVFIVSAVVTLFQYSMEQGWLTNTLKIGFGLLAGAGLGIAGMKLTDSYRWTGELLFGAGAGLLYATIAFAGIYYDLWSPMTVFLGMVAVTILLIYYAYRHDSRLLMATALSGALLSPLMMRPETDQVFTLFLYLLVVNVAFFTLSILKSWTELRIGAFGGSWLLYAVYFIHFDPVMTEVWSLPFRYAFAAFIFYVLALMLASWRQPSCFDGWNLYLGMANGILFGLWAIVIWEGIVHYAVPLGGMGILYSACGMLIFRTTGRMATAAGSYVVSGLLLCLLAVTHMGQGMDIKPLVNVYIWSAVAAATVYIGQKRGRAWSLYGGYAVWFVVVCYWYGVTWDSPRGDWFGTFVPFLNWGAISWLLLAALGFYFSLIRHYPGANQDGQQLLRLGSSVAAHLIVGGLLTLQILTAFQVYGWETSGTLQITLSAMWGLHSLLLFLWGGFSRQVFFRWFGAIVLILVAFKSIFIDLEGQETLLKVGVLLILGLLSFVITWINGRWILREERSQENGEPTSV